ncbi:hypothetical protein Patl1_12754 [Pistacia atlantica]|uniref:Uncharacterized protein n=1 Tax=Pistacia atlantica TaxID=434234 RepID=A0ACC1ASX4_9ROSI|nr:hypothetical protein Patl1_12754 [Pistacia atlantica]
MVSVRWTRIQLEIVSMVLIGKVKKNSVSLMNKAGGTDIGSVGMDERLSMARPQSKLGLTGFRRGGGPSRPHSDKTSGEAGGSG